MKLRLLEIWNFRGIKEMEWKPSAGFNLILGAGDSGKTTILDAIDFALGPRFNLAFTDADFYNSDTTQNIRIRATVGDLPPKIKSDLRFETHYRGWHNGVLSDEPQEHEDQQDELVLTIQLEVSDTLEPIWEVWTERDPETRPACRSQDREHLGVVRIGAYIDRHLSWGRGSALSQYSDSIDNLNPIFAQVRRDTQASFGEQDLPELRAITANLSTQAGAMGVNLNSQLSPGLEITALQSTASAVALFDGTTPARQMGLGSRRLLVTTMQLEKTAEKSLLLVDEIESALEPHRIRNLVRTLACSGLQLVVTTHAPIAVQEAAEQTIFFVRQSEGITKLTELPKEIRVNLKKSPYGALAKQVLVCEGRTEQGFLAACKSIWAKAGGTDLDALGIAEAYGEGQPNGGKLALAFARLEVNTGFYYDSDRGPGFSLQEADEAGLSTFPCVDGFNAESSLFESLTDDQIHEVLNHVRDSGRCHNLRLVLEEFFEMPSDQSILWPGKLSGSEKYSSEREALVAAAKGNGVRNPNYSGMTVYWSPWLKDAETAREVLLLVADPWEDFKATQLGSLLEKIRIWCYES